MTTPDDDRAQTDTQQQRGRTGRPRRPATLTAALWLFVGWIAMHGVDTALGVSAVAAQDTSVRPGVLVSAVLFNVTIGLLVTSILIRVWLGGRVARVLLTIVSCIDVVSIVISLTVSGGVTFGIAMAALVLVTAAVICLWSTPSRRWFRERTRQLASADHVARGAM
jgi:hypothetical protein